VAAAVVAAVAAVVAAAVLLFEVDPKRGTAGAAS
jgi:hypothetical protein